MVARVADRMLGSHGGGNLRGQFVELHGDDPRVDATGHLHDYKVGQQLDPRVRHELQPSLPLCVYITLSQIWFLSSNNPGSS